MSKTPENTMSEEQKLTPEENLRNINLILEELEKGNPELSDEP